MAQTNTVLTQIAVKRLSGKAQTNANNSLGQEPKGSTVQTTAATVFAEALPNNPAQTLYLIQSESIGSSGTAMFAEFEIRAFGDQYANDGQDGETTVNTYHSYELILSTSFDDGISSGDFDTHASTPTSFGTFPFDGGSSMTGSRGRLQIIPEFVSDIPAGLGASNPYIPQLFSTANPDSSPISPTDGIDWYLDAYSGILFIQDPVAYGSIGAPNSNAAVPYKIKAFAYVGKYQDQMSYGISDISLHISASEGDAFDLVNNNTASFESGSAGITVTADASKKITIGKATDTVTFADITGSNLLITNTASITYFETTYESSSIIFSSGSTKFGDTNDDTHVFTGSVDVLFTGSNGAYGTYGIELTGSGLYVEHDLSISASGDISASALYLTNELTALDGGVTINSNTSPELFVGGNITASGDISASGLLFASASEGLGGSNIEVAMYDTATGQFYYTGSSALGDTTLLEASASAGIHVSASEGTGFSIGLMQSASFTSGSGGGLTVTAGTGNNIEFELVGVLSSSAQIATDISGAIGAATSSVLSEYGLLSSSAQIATDISGAIGAATGSLLSEYGLLSSSAQIATDISGAIGAATASLSASIVGTANEVEVVGTAGGTIQIGLPDNVTITGDLTVNGTTTSINTDQLLVQDPFILLASSSGAPNKDGGIIVQTGAGGTGTALFYDNDKNRWGLTKADETAYDATTVTPRQFVVTISSSAANPTSNPSDFGNDSNSWLGMMYVATTDNDNDTNTIWIYG
tara:strand:- start:2168 stop:4441 length:2274 start_codon:yes stop_codon:yes gene_type:complete